MSDWRDLVIEGLSDSEVELRERVASLEHDLFWYRAIAVEAIHALHRKTRQVEALREQRHPRDQQQEAFA